MSAANISVPDAITAYAQLRDLTLRACESARLAAEALGNGLASGTPQHLDPIKVREEELDNYDRQINEGVTSTISHVNEEQARELLTCLKFVIELERIGDLLLSVSSRARAVAGRIEPQDTKDLTVMASLLEKMLGDAAHAYSHRDLGRALAVLRADAEMDRIRNLMFVRHIENPENKPRQESFHLVFMTQTLERAGDHCKNLAEEVCHLVSGRSIRHLMRASDKSFEQMFVDWMRKREKEKK